MKLSQVLHVISVVVGVGAIATAFVGLSSEVSELVWGLTREHVLLCSGLLFLAAIWFGAGAIHHVMLEDRGRVL